MLVAPFRGEVMATLVGATVSIVIGVEALGTLILPAVSVAGAICCIRVMWSAKRVTLCAKGRPVPSWSASSPAGEGGDDAVSGGRARSYEAGSQSANTWRTDRSDMRHFGAWYQRRGLAALPAEPDTVRLYLADQAGRRARLHVAPPAVGHRRGAARPVRDQQHGWVTRGPRPRRARPSSANSACRGVPVFAGSRHGYQRGPPPALFGAARVPASPRARGRERAAGPQA